MESVEAVIGLTGALVMEEWMAREEHPMLLSCFERSNSEAWMVDQLAWALLRVGDSYGSRSRGGRLTELKEGSCSVGI